MQTHVRYQVSDNSLFPLLHFHRVMYCISVAIFVKLDPARSLYVTYSVNVALISDIDI